MARCGHHYPIQECAICFEDGLAAEARLEETVIQWEERALAAAAERDEARQVARDIRLAFRVGAAVEPALRGLEDTYRWLTEEDVVDP